MPIWPKNADIAITKITGPGRFEVLKVCPVKFWAIIATILYYSLSVSFRGQ